MLNILHRSSQNRCRMHSILRRSLTRDRLRLVRILHRSSQNRCRMHCILSRSLTRDRLRMIRILHRLSQNRCRMSFFIFLIRKIRGGHTPEMLLPTIIPTLYNNLCQRGNCAIMLKRFVNLKHASSNRINK